MSIYESFRNEGKSAQAAGKTVNDNPYAAESRAHGQWLQGFAAAVESRQPSKADMLAAIGPCGK